jgi:hypothetical protein
MNRQRYRKDPAPSAMVVNQTHQNNLTLGGLVMGFEDMGAGA